MGRTAAGWGERQVSLSQSCFPNLLVGYIIAAMENNNDTNGTIEREQTDYGAVLRTYLVSAALLSLLGIMLALSEITDAARTGADLPSGRFWVNEMSGTLTWLLALPLVNHLAANTLLKDIGWPQKVMRLAIGLVLCSAVHITAMMVIRYGIYTHIWGQPAMSLPDYSGGILYEFRKDIVAFTVFLLIFTGSRLLAEQHAALSEAARRNAGAGRIMLKSGGTSIWLNCANFISAEAAGNYVNISAEGGDYFVRMTLSQLAKDLSDAGDAPTRCHRSWLISPSHIEQVRPTGDGDYVITLKGGASVPGSRRLKASFL